MRLLPTPPRATAAAAAAAAALLLPSLSLVSAAWDCETKQGGRTYDFTSLAGKHEVFHKEDTHPHVRNTTWQISPCGPLPKPKNANTECPAGTYVCAQVRFTREGGKEELEEVIAIAGDFDDRKLNENVTLFNSPDKGQIVRITLHGGPIYSERTQSAVIDFVCDKERTGLEGSKAVVEEQEAEGEGATVVRRRDEATNPDKSVDPSLKYISYITDSKSKPETQTLFLEWRTKHACVEFAKGDSKEEDKGSSHWGFFTWIFIIFFLGMATYLILGSWINYNQYGSRGWDLLPHSDTVRDAIRDIPYLLKDFMRSVMGTLQGRSSAGYSAV